MQEGCTSCRVECNESTRHPISLPPPKLSLKDGAALALPYYKRNLIILWATNFLAACSWTLWIPFLPLFIRELGVHERVETWAGILFSANFIASAVMAPVWGSLADRFGRKPMIVRAGFSLTVVYFGMALVTNHWQLLALRILNGLLTGFIPSSIALVATNTPEDRVGRYLGVLQTASASGTILGPILGGTLADFIGLRSTMMVAGSLTFVAVWLVVFGVKEGRTKVTTAKFNLIGDFATAFRMPVLLTVALTMILAQTSLLSLEPILALYVGELVGGSAPHWVSGAIFSLPGLAFILAAPWWSRRGERVGFDTILATGLLFAGLFFLPQALARGPLDFAGLRFLAGLALAAVQPGAGALIATKVPAEFRGRAYGIHQTAMFVGNVMGPLIGGFLGSLLGPRSVFLFTGTTLLATTFWLRRSQKRQRVRDAEGSGSAESVGNVESAGAGAQAMAHKSS